MSDKGKSSKNQDDTLLRIVPLGGLGEIGKNMLVLEYGDDMIIVDVGLMFPTSDMHGIDIIIPDAEYVLEQADKVRGIFLTHGHEDHIGALSYLMEEGLRAPVYATSLTRGLVEVKLRENKLLGEAQLNTIEDDDVVEAGVFTVEFFHTTHSFPDSVGLCIAAGTGHPHQRLSL